MLLSHHRRLCHGRLAEGKNAYHLNYFCLSENPGEDSAQLCFRSSMATARRMSRASGMGVGIPLPDLLSTVPGPDEASVKERLEKMVNLVVNSTIRFLL